jgi:geranylgeranyl pyrophosphate synthase
LASSPHIAAAKELARSYGDKAREALNQGLNDQKTRSEECAEALYSVIDFALERLK